MHHIIPHKKSEPLPLVLASFRTWAPCASSFRLKFNDMAFPQTSVIYQAHCKAHALWDWWSLIPLFDSSPDLLIFIVIRDESPLFECTMYFSTGLGWSCNLRRADQEWRGKRPATSICYSSKASSKGLCILSTLCTTCMPTTSLSMFVCECWECKGILRKKQRGSISHTQRCLKCKCKLDAYYLHHMQARHPPTTHLPNKTPSPLPSELIVNAIAHSKN